MIITLSPQAGGELPAISVSGSTITYNGVEYDLSSIPVDGQAQGESPAIGTIKNVAGIIHITLEYPYDSKLAEPNQSTDQQDYVFDASSGDVPSPIVMKPVEEPPQ